MQKNKVYSVDAMRSISIFGVILIHTTTKVLEASHYDLVQYWPTLLLNQISRFAVPLFFLISGFVLELSYGALADKEGFGLLKYIKKRFSKILIPYLFWSLIYYFLIYTNNTENLLLVFLKGSASYQLYFIPSICIFYIIFPILHKFYKYLASPPVLVLLGYLQLRLMNQDYFIKQFSLPDPIRICLLAYFIFIVGMVAAKNINKIKKFAKWTWIGLIPIFIYLASYIYQEGKNMYFQTYNIGAFYSQWRGDIFIYTLIVGLISFHIFRKSNHLTAKISKISYLVFFIHIIVLEFYWKNIGLKLFNNTSLTAINVFYMDTLFFIAVATSSFLIAVLAHKIPKLNVITG